MKYIVTIFVTISSITSVQAIYFSEIMFDPIGSDSPREWVEIYNDTGSSINFTTWKFFESGVNHGLTSYSGGTNVSSGAYAIIADNAQQFLSDYPSYSGVLYDSSFSLSNSGEQLILKDGTLSAIDTVTYNVTIGGNNDGSTLLKIDGTWVRGSATPGNINQSLPLSITSSNTTYTTTENQQTVAQMSPPSADIVLYMPFEKIVVAGAETEFSTYGMTRAGKNIEGLNINWSFGDGGVGNGSTTKYVYSYPGRYIAQVEGANGYVIGKGRMVVRVVTPDITITKFGTGKYGNYIDILNPNNYELDLSQWKLLIDGNGYLFPKNTLIAGNSITHFSGRAMGFASTTISTSTVVKILFPNLEEVTKYTHLGEDINSIPKTTPGFPMITASIIRPKKLIIKNTDISSTSQKLIGSTTTAETISLQTNLNKDKRIITWLKSLFLN